MANTFLGGLTATTVPASDTVVPVVRNGQAAAEISTLANLAKGFAAVGKVAVTQPANGSTLVIADGQTLTCNASVTLGTAAGSATGDFALASKFVAGAGALTGPAAPLTIGTIAAAATGDYATSAKFVAGAGALTGPAAPLTIGTIASAASGDYATSASFIAGAGALTGPAAPLTVGTAAASAVGDFATSAKFIAGAGALTGPASPLTIGTIAAAATSDYATSAKFVAGAGALTGPASPLTIGTAASAATGDFAPAAGSSSIVTVGTISSGNVVGGIADASLSYSKLANGTDGNLITWDADGHPAVVATGTAAQVLTSNGAGAAPTFQNPSGTSRVSYSTVGGDAGSWSASGTGGAVVLNPDYVRLSSASVSGGGYAIYLDLDSGSGRSYWGAKNVNVRFVGTLSIDTSTNFISAYLLGQPDAPSSSAVKLEHHVGFILDRNVLYASNADGAAQTLTDISSGVTVTDSNIFDIIVSSTDIKFYVNGSLKATHTTNRPSTASYFYVKALLANDAGVSTLRYCYLNNYSLSYNTL